jgi:plasmid stabilization system protein ParE
MNVVITADAEIDLERIGDAIAQHNPVRAITFVRELRRKCETLAFAPRRFALIPRYEHQYPPACSWKLSDFLSHQC